MDKKSESNAEKILVEVAYALPTEQTLLAFDVPKGSSAKDAISMSGIMEKHPEIDLEHNKIGIFGKVVAATEELRDKDRVEIYRPLIADPKESRRKRAEKKEKTKSE